MDGHSQFSLGHVFPRVDVLTAPSRVDLSQLLATAGSMPAVLPEEIGDLPLPATGDARQALRRVIEGGLGPEALASLRTLPLSDVVPPIQPCEGGPLALDCPARLSALLIREGTTTWANLASLTLAEMSRWTSMGPRSVAVLIGIAVEAALRTVPGGPGEAGEAGEAGECADEPHEPHEPESVALARLLHHEKVAGTDNLRRTLEAHASGDGPTEVAAAAARLLAAADRIGDPRLALLDRIWTATGDHRERGVLAHRSIRLDRRLSTKDLAAALAVTETRVGQIQATVERRARGAADAGGASLEKLVDDLRPRIGPVSNLAGVDEALATLGLPAHDDPRSGLAVWLAGPYLPVSGQEAWVAIDPVGFVAATRHLLREDGGVRQLDHVAADLAAAGLAARGVGDWLSAQPVTLIDGLVVSLFGSPADVAERILSATGRAMTARELTAMASRPDAAAVLDGRLMRDRRFVRVDPERFELIEWGGAAFAEPPPTAPAELFPGAGRGRTHFGRSTLRIDVDAAVLRGAGEPVPLAVMEALGVPCGGRRTFSTRFGPVALSHKAAQPTRGSVRPVALAAGASEGDALLIEFDAATGDASVELVVASHSAAS